MTNIEKDYELIKYMEDEKQEMARDANDVIVEILESYLEFLQYAIDMPKAFIKPAAMSRINKWRSILDTAQAQQKEFKKNDNTKIRKEDNEQTLYTNGSY